MLLLLQLKPFNKTKRKVATRVLPNRLATEVFADDFMRYKLLKEHAQLAKTPLKLTKHRSEVLLDHVIWWAARIDEKLDLKLKYQCCVSSKFVTEKTCWKSLSGFFSGINRYLAWIKNVRQLQDCYKLC